MTDDEGVGLAWIALGSSLGPRAATLRSALESLAALPGARTLRVSPIYETRPVGTATHPFFNGVAEVDFAGAITPRSLLDALRDIEHAHGRIRARPWDDRTLDLDLLLVWSAHGAPIVRRDEILELPHPRIGERDFVLQPWLDLRPTLVLPDGRALLSLLANLAPDQRTVERVVAPTEDPDP